MLQIFLFWFIFSASLAKKSEHHEPAKHSHHSSSVSWDMDRPAPYLQYFPRSFPFDPSRFNVTVEEKDEAAAKKFILEIEPWLNAMDNLKEMKNWKFTTDITNRNEDAANKATNDAQNFEREKIFPLRKQFDYTKFKDRKLKRLFWIESLQGESALPPKQSERLNALINEMTKIYSTATVCEFKNASNCDIPLDNDITDILSKSHNPEKLKHYWVEWHEKSGKKMTHLFKEYVEISNEAAKLNGFPSAGHYWRRPYEDTLMPQKFWALWGQIRPFYEELHAYVRRMLLKRYGAKIVSPTGPIPGHLLGNMWGQEWSGIRDIVTPFSSESKEVVDTDVTRNMVKANMTVKEMFQKADDFFVSLGLPKLPKTFWSGSIFQRPPPPRELLCHPEAWDLSNGEDFWIKMCGVVTGRDFETVHHEMGHTQYQMHYRHQLNTFRDGANPGFHEAIGDVIALSVTSPKHMQKTLKLLPAYKDTKKNQINFLLAQALQLIVDLPHALSLEQWRWDVFDKVVYSDEYNCHWWTLRTSTQGVKPPVLRSWKDFDPGSKFHIPSSTPYDRYFLARILTYQLHESFCKLAGEYEEGNKDKPLHMCSIYGNKKAGDKLKELLSLGMTEKWQKVLQTVTGKNRLDAGPVLRYYAPLIQWLKATNKKNGDTPGWDVEDFEETICAPDKPAP